MSQSYGAQKSSGGGNPNPISTLGFLWNMGYPPPPITMDSLKKLAESCIDNNTFNLPEKALQAIINELKANPFSRCPVVLFVIQQALHSSKLEKVSNAMELTHAVFMEMRLEFARYLNREFMVSVKNVINTTSYKDRTVTGSLKKLEKWVVGASSSGVATDPKVQTLQKRCLQILRIWVDLTINQEIECMAIHDLYRKLSSRGYQFPSPEVQLPPLASFMASTSYGSGSYGEHSQMHGVGGVPQSRMTGFGSQQMGQFGHPAAQTAPSYPNYPATRMPPPPRHSRSGESEEIRPIDDAQLPKLAKALQMQQAPENQAKPEVQERCLNVFKKMIPRVNARIVELSEGNSYDPNREETLRRILQIKDEMDLVIQRAENPAPEDDDFADLGLDDNSPFSQNSCPFQEPISAPLPSGTTPGATIPYSESPRYAQNATARYSGFQSLASSDDDDLIGGRKNQPPPPPPPEKAKIVDPFAALNDVWENE